MITFFSVIVLHVIQLQIHRKQNRLLECSEQLTASKRIDEEANANCHSWYNYNDHSKEKSHNPQTFISVHSYLQRGTKFWAVPCRVPQRARAQEQWEGLRHHTSSTHWENSWFKIRLGPFCMDSHGWHSLCTSAQAQAEVQIKQTSEAEVYWTEGTL